MTKIGKLKNNKYLSNFIFKNVIERIINGRANNAVDQSTKDCYDCGNEFESFELLVQHWLNSTCRMNDII